jgi:hypothetical protein
VRLAIDAPRSTRVDREEVAVRIARDGFQHWCPEEPDVLTGAGDAVVPPRRAELGRLRFTSGRFMSPCS